MKILHHKLLESSQWAAKSLPMMEVGKHCAAEAENAVGNQVMYNV